MPIIEKDSQPFEPYARLMNVIGDQLITDKKVAVIEIMKNSYDADSENVDIRFFNMEKRNPDLLVEKQPYIEIKDDGNSLTESEDEWKQQPYIEIEDDGDGMTLKIIKEIWLRPATPNKLNKKKQKKNITKKGRIIQGEKGIGRFAIHKLGEKIEVYTKAEGNHEVKLDMDFTEFNPEKMTLFNQPPPEYKLLNKVYNKWYVNDPPEEIKKPKGTLIRIYNLRENWKDRDFSGLYKAIQRLIPPVDENAKKIGVDFKSDFEVNMFLNEKIYTSEQATTFKDVIERAQYTMIGTVSKTGVLSFEYKSISPVRTIAQEVDLFDKDELARLNYNPNSIKRWFEKNERKPICGEFKFTFYAFDLRKPDKLILNKDIEKFIKDNFVYVLRDGVRVYPYGEKGYDWLKLDKLRAVVRAGDYLSSNDLTGFVYITQEGNPFLKDSTNRQGIMNIDNASDDFDNLVTTVTEVFNTEIKIDKAKIDTERKKASESANVTVKKHENAFKDSLEKTQDKDVVEKGNKYLEAVEKREVAGQERTEIVQDLAGLGMAVEKASHDALMLLSKMRNNIKDFKIKVKKQSYTNEELITLLDELSENLNFIYDEMQIIQPLFKVQRKSIKDISLYDSIIQVKKYFRREIEGKIDVNIIKDNDIIIKTNKGAIFQIIINLIDNAIYWVNQNETPTPKIIFKIDTENNSFIIADNGPGIREDALPLVFNEFFSLKSDGRGLGLYIVKEILLRINGEISVIQEEKNKLLSGANFRVSFTNDPK